jgi:methyltransferase (TIGR00027 family)
MKRYQSSITAENNALLRAHESLRSRDDRICHDPYAVYFLPDHILSSKNKAPLIQTRISDWETHFPGVGRAIIARTRFMDDCLKEAIESGIRQLVILGAGYDTRAIRFETLNNGITVFELDHPATQDVKMGRMRKYVKADVSHVRYLPIDFSKEVCDAKLFAGGYNRELKTFFIMEGISYYISKNALEQTLSFIARHSPANSGLVFDYFPPAVADGTTDLTEARALRAGLKQIGEEIVSGLAPGQMTEFMERRGFAMIQNISGKAYMDTRFKKETHAGYVSGMFMFALARVC